MKSLFGVVVITAGSALIPVVAADVATGKSVAQAQCVQCHEADDWDGEDAASLESL